MRGSCQIHNVDRIVDHKSDLMTAENSRCGMFHSGPPQIAGEGDNRNGQDGGFEEPPLELGLRHQWTWNRGVVDVEASYSYSCHYGQNGSGGSAMSLWYEMRRLDILCLLPRSFHPGSSIWSLRLMLVKKSQRTHARHVDDFLEG